MNRPSEILRAGRLLVRRPGFLALASATLAVAVSAMVGTFTLLDAIVLRPPPWPDHERVVVYGGRTPDDAMRAVSPRLYAAVGLPSSVVSRGSVRMPETVNVIAGRHRELLRAQRADAGLLSTLGVVPLYGQAPTASDNGLLLSHTLWIRWFAADPTAVGRTVIVDGRDMTVRGVLPADYRFFSDVDLLLPFDPAATASDAAENMTAVARLAPGRDVADFSADVARAASRAAAGLGLRDEDLRWYGATPVDDLVASGARGSLWLFAACALLVLAMAGVNVSHLISTRMLERVDETALKMVFGAHGSTPWAPALTDALAAGFVACAAGLPIGNLMVGFFHGFLPPDWSNSGLPPAPAWRVVAVVILMTQVVAVLAALSGASKVRTPLLRRERSAMVGSTGFGRIVRRARISMLLAEVALATLLVALGVAASARAYRLTVTSSGFNSSHAVVVELHVPASDYPGAAEMAHLAEAMRAGVMRLAGVDAMGWSSQLPSGRAFMMPFLRADGSSEFLEFGLVTGGGSQAMGLLKLAGRWFDEGDGASTERVALVNEAYLRHFASDGLSDVVRPAGENGRTARIVGVVKDTLRDDRVPTEPAVFIPLAQAGERRLALVRRLAPIHLVIRGPAAAAVARDDLPGIVGKLDPALVVSPPTPLDRIARAPLAAANRNVVLFSTLSLFAVGLAAVGQYTVQAADVAARRDIIALRGAFGATPMSLLGGVLQRALYVAMVGIGLGLVATYFLQRWIYPKEEWLEGIGASVAAIAALVMALAALAAAFVPARRAAAVEPWRVLRSE